MSIVYIIIAIVIFGVLIAVHELGHFMAAKACGVRVNEFAIGMGPAVWQGTRGETTYSLRILPIGGYCAMEGEEDESDDPRALNSKSLWRRFVIFAAGAFMNFVIGVVIIFVLFSSADSFYTSEITGLADGFPSQGESGLMAGDVVKSIDGEPIYIYSDISLFLSMGNGSTYDFVVNRDGKRVALNDVYMPMATYKTADGKDYQGHGIFFGATVSATVGEKLKMTALNSADFVRLVWYSLGKLVTGAVGLNDMSGPVGIVSTISTVGAQSSSAAEAAQNIAYLAALIAINLAVMNLLPIPALDGGHIFLMLVSAAITAVTKKKLNPKWEAYINTAGFAAMMLLMAVITFSDVFKLIK
jgi:regulator of sigma E protease